MTQSEANKKFRLAVERVMRARREFAENISFYTERYTNLNNDYPTLADDYEENVNTDEIDELVGFINDFQEELTGISDDLISINEEELEEEEEDPPHDYDDERQSEGEE